MRSPRWNCRNAKTPRPLAPASAILNPGILVSSFSAAADAPPSSKKALISAELRHQKSTTAVLEIHLPSCAAEKLPCSLLDTAPR